MPYLANQINLQKEHMNDIASNAIGIQPLIDSAWLSRHQDSKEISIIAIQHKHPEAEQPAFKIGGAHAFHWKELLWDDYQRQFASAEVLRLRLAAAGIDVDSHLVFYGEPTQFGFYARWAFLRAGLQRVSVLNGGLRAWRADDFPVVELAALQTVIAAPLHGDPHPEDAGNEQRIRIGRDEIRQRLNDSTLRILDIRTTEEYDGKRVSPEGGANNGAERGGHIPGATLFAFADLLDQDGRLRPLAELQAKAAAARLDPTQETVVYCRLSHRSTLAFFVLTELLGFSHVRVYDGSWTEWGSLVGAPIAR